jgi:hypothetical protein
MPELVANNRRSAMNAIRIMIRSEMIEAASKVLEARLLAAHFHLKNGTVGHDPANTADFETIALVVQELARDMNSIPLESSIQTNKCAMLGIKLDYLLRLSKLGE